MSDVTTELHAFKMNPIDRFIDDPLRVAQRIAERSHGEHASAAHLDFAVGIGRPGVEHVDVDVVVGGFRDTGGQSTYCRTLARRFRIAAGRDDDGQGRAAIPLRLDRIQLPIDSVLDQRQQVALKAKQDDFRLGVTEARVEFDHARIAIGIDHQAGVQETGERRALARHAFDHGSNDFAHHAIVHRGCHDRRRRIRAHPAGVGADVGVLQPFVVLGGGERQHMLAVGHHDEARFLTVHEFFDDDPRCAARVLNRELARLEDRIECRVCFVDGHRDDDALARGQAVGLDDDRRGLAFKMSVDIRARCIDVGERPIARGRNVVTQHERLGEIFRRFKLRGSARRAEDA